MLISFIHFYQLKQYLKLQNNYQTIINLKLLIVKLMIGIQRGYLRIKELAIYNGGNIRLEQVFNYFL